MGINYPPQLVNARISEASTVPWNLLSKGFSFNDLPQVIHHQPSPATKHWLIDDDETSPILLMEEILHHLTSNLYIYISQVVV